jgi:site-specific DNA recombinase
MNVVCYIRVSTEEQATDGVSLKAQRAKVEAYAALYDLTVVAVVEDAGQSAKTLNRPGLQTALDMLNDGAADGMVIVKLDRLTRNVGDWQELIDGYFGEKAGKQLMSVSDSIDTRTAAGRLVLNVLLSVAQWERETIGERTKDALRYKISKGERCGKVRYGYDVDGKMLVANEQEQAVIRLMVDLRLAGKTLRAIANELTIKGIATKEGNAKWTHTAVAYILKRAA